MGMLVSKISKLYLDWVRRGLDKPGKNQKGLGAAIGVSESVVSRLLAGKRRIQTAELSIISIYIDEPIPAEGRVTTPNEHPPQNALGSAQAVPLVRVVAIIAPSVWREAGVSLAIAEKIPASPDPRIAGMKQYACRIEAESNRYAICVPYSDIRAKPMPNDVVHVRRTVRGQFEDTLRIVRIANGTVRLQLEGAPTKDRSAVLDFVAGKSGEDIEIKGLVVGYFHAATF